MFASLLLILTLRACAANVSGNVESLTLNLRRNINFDVVKNYPNLKHLKLNIQETECDVNAFGKIVQVIDVKQANIVRNNANDGVPKKGQESVNDGGLPNDSDGRQNSIKDAEQKIVHNQDEESVNNAIGSTTRGEDKRGRDDDKTGISDGRQSSVNYKEQESSTSSRELLNLNNKVLKSNNVKILDNTYINNLQINDQMQHSNNEQSNNDLRVNVKDSIDKSSVNIINSQMKTESSNNNTKSFELNNYETVESNKTLKNSKHDNDPYSILINKERVNKNNIQIFDSNNISQVTDVKEKQYVETLESNYKSKQIVSNIDANSNHNAVENQSVQYNIKNNLPVSARINTNNNDIRNSGHHSKNHLNESAFHVVNDSVLVSDHFSTVNYSVNYSVANGAPKFIYQNELFYANRNIPKMNNKKEIDLNKVFKKPQMLEVSEDIKRLLKSRKKRHVFSAKSNAEVLMHLTNYMTKDNVTNFKDSEKNSKPETVAEFNKQADNITAIHFERLKGVNNSIPEHLTTIKNNLNPTNYTPTKTREHISVTESVLTGKSSVTKSLPNDVEVTNNVKTDVPNYESGLQFNTNQNKANNIVEVTNLKGSVQKQFTKAIVEIDQKNATPYFNVQNKTMEILNHRRVDYENNSNTQVIKNISLTPNKTQEVINKPLILDSDDLKKPRLELLKKIDEDFNKMFNNINETMQTLDIEKNINQDGEIDQINQTVLLDKIKLNNTSENILEKETLRETWYTKHTNTNKTFNQKNFLNQTILVKENGTNNTENTHFINQAIKTLENDKYLDVDDFNTTSKTMKNESIISSEIDTNITNHNYTHKELFNKSTETNIVNSGIELQTEVTFSSKTQNIKLNHSAAQNDDFENGTTFESLHYKYKDVKSANREFPIDNIELSNTNLIKNGTVLKTNENLGSQIITRTNVFETLNRKNHRLETLSAKIDNVETLNNNINNHKDEQQSLLDPYTSTTRPLTSEKLSCIPKLTNLTNLITLDISHNSLTTQKFAHLLPRDNLQFNLVLEILNISHNNLELIHEDTFANLKQIKLLDLSWNKITSFEFRLVGLENLQYLNLSGNMLEYLDEEYFAGAAKLQQLDLSYNRLRRLSSALLLDMINLVRLNLEGNFMLGEDFFFVGTSGKRLEWLEISNCGLQRVPQALTRSVRTLRLTLNLVNVVREGDLDSYPLLRVLDLSGNRIEEVEEDSLGRLDFLIILYLSNNYLNVIPHSLPEKLKVLHLEGNYIRALKKVDFQNLNQLEVLLLYNNRISSLEDEPFADLHSLVTLDLSRNPINVLSSLQGPRNLRVLRLAEINAKTDKGDLIRLGVDQQRLPKPAIGAETDTYRYSTKRTARDVEKSQDNIQIAPRNTFATFLAQLIKSPKMNSSDPNREVHPSGRQSRDTGKLAEVSSNLTKNETLKPTDTVAIDLADSVNPISDIERFTENSEVDDSLDTDMEGLSSDDGRLAEITDDAPEGLVGRLSSAIGKFAEIAQARASEGKLANLTDDDKTGLRRFSRDVENIYDTSEIESIVDVEKDNIGQLSNGVEDNMVYKENNRNIQNNFEDTTMFQQINVETHYTTIPLVFNIHEINREDDSNSLPKIQPSSEDKSERNVDIQTHTSFFSQSGYSTPQKLDFDFGEPSNFENVEQLNSTKPYEYPNFPLPNPERLVTLDLHGSPTLAKLFLYDQATLKALKSLQELDISSSQLSHIPPELMFLPQLRKLKIGDNPLNCTNLEWLADFLRRQDDAEGHGISCTYPEELWGTPLMDLQILAEASKKDVVEDEIEIVDEVKTTRSNYNTTFIPFLKPSKYSSSSPFKEQTFSHPGMLILGLGVVACGVLIGAMAMRFRWRIPPRRYRHNYDYREEEEDIEVASLASVTEIW